jgi:hypothetical protein
MRGSSAAAGLCLVAAIVAGVAGLQGRGGASDPRPGPASAGTSPATLASASNRPTKVDSGFPAAVGAMRMAPTYVRLPVPSADLNNLVRVRGNIIIALADKGAFFGEVYAAISDDDGGDWRIDSPQFARAGACGSCTTNHLTVSGDGTIVAWGNDGNIVKVTTDLGRHWHQALFTGGIKTVTTTGRRLEARVLGDQNSRGRFPTRRYVSTDNGATWHRGRPLPTVNY